MTLTDAADVWHFTPEELGVHNLQPCATDDRSVVYVLHFDPPLHHARHYIGIAHDGDVTRRLRQHRKGRGSSLVAAAIAAGSFVSVVLILPGDLGLERRLHNRHGTRVCPVCKGEGVPLSAQGVLL
jgi:hypothetical protein